MIRTLSTFIVALLIQGCATRTPGTDALSKDHAGLVKSHKINSVPFIKQEINHCGPASLGMVLKFHERDINLDELTQQMYTPGSKGTFSMDFITSVRRQGMLGIAINDLKSLLLEISSGHPVIVFQNLGFSSMPNWHYAVALGYDLSGPDLILHSGKNKFLKTDMRMFERSWSMANHWALVVLPPGKLAASADDLEHVEGISGLEKIGNLDAARKSYEVVLKKWPQSLPALIGMGNVLYSKKDFSGSLRYLTEATRFHPDSAMAWHNLATAQGAAGLYKDARVSSKKALTLVESSELPAYKESLKNWL